MCLLPPATCPHPDAVGRGQRPELRSDGGASAGLVVAAGSPSRFLVELVLNVFVEKTHFYLLRASVFITCLVLLN